MLAMTMISQVVVVNLVGMRRGVCGGLQLLAVVCDGFSGILLLDGAGIHADYEFAR